MLRVRDVRSGTQALEHVDDHQLRALSCRGAVLGGDDQHRRLDQGAEQDLGDGLRITRRKLTRLDRGAHQGEHDRNPKLARCRTPAFPTENGTALGQADAPKLLVGLT